MANKEIKLGNKIINANSTPYLIAEIGINHNGDLELAKKEKTLREHGYQVLVPQEVST